MPVQFKVYRINAKILKIETDNEEYKTVGKELKHSLKNLQYSMYRMPNNSARDHYTLLIAQM